ncbi:hypothetical protein Tco_0276065 [Tanacetum coccineum]
MVIILKTTFGGCIPAMDIPDIQTFLKDKPKFRNWVKLSDPKQALRGRHPYGFILVTGCSGFLKPLVIAVFVLRSKELHNP